MAFLGTMAVQPWAVLIADILSHSQTLVWEKLTDTVHLDISSHLCPNQRGPDLVSWIKTVVGRVRVRQ